MSLAEAREKARTNRKVAREGGGSPRQAAQWMARLRSYAFSRIADVAVSEITSTDVLEILTPI